jgi:N-acetyl-anhydromuramyl-L-alanine amidase AmpD
MPEETLSGSKTATVKKIDADGMLTDERVQKQRYPKIEHGSLALESINAIVVHQTGAATASSTMYAYEDQITGAHFLISETGIIYQTASLLKICYHVGKIRAKCIELKNCKDNDTIKTSKGDVKIGKLPWSSKYTRLIHDHENSKKYPDRFPTNEDSVGIEIVGKSISEDEYQEPSEVQNESLKWLVKELSEALSQIGKDDIYRHPDISYKDSGEAKDAKWE